MNDPPTITHHHAIPVNRAVRIIRAVMALLVLAALLAGIPTALWIVGHGWLPSEIPNLHQVWHALTTRDTGTLLLAVATVVGFLAWAIFAASVALELVARLRRRPAPHLRGVRWAQGIASVLLTTVISGLIGTSATAMSTRESHTANPIPRTTAETTQSVSARSGQATDSKPAQPPPARQQREQPRTIVVGPRTTLWGLAQQWYGDGRHYTKILAFNLGRVQPDGRSLTANGRLQTGWVLHVPADAPLNATAFADPAATSNIVVRPGDSLSTIAHDKLGDASQYMKIFNHNKGKLQPDGRSLADPDKIYPGWTLAIPAATVATHRQQPPTPTMSLPQQATVATPAPSASTPSTSPAPIAPAQPAPPNAHTQLPPQQPPPEQHLSAPSGTDSADTPAPLGVPTALLVSGIAGTALLAGLALARRRQQRHRATGRQVALPTQAAIPVDKALRGARPQADVTFLDLSLRSLGTLLAEMTIRNDPPELPEVVGAWLGAGGLRLLLRTPCYTAPLPFIANPDGTEWSVLIDADLPVTPENATDQLAPLPTLASVGRSEPDHDQLMIDLESLSPVHLGGDPTKARDLLRHLAAELAHNRWSHHIDVLLVGIGEALTALNPDRLRYVASLDEAISRLRNRVAGSHQPPIHPPVQPVMHGRLHEPFGDLWTPEVLLVDCEPDNAPAADSVNVSAPTDSTASHMHELLSLLAATQRPAVAVIIVGAAAVPDATTISITADGTLCIPELTTRSIHAEGITSDLVPLVVDLFAATSASDDPIPPADEPVSWAKDMDASGRLMWTDARTPQTLTDEEPVCLDENADTAATNSAQSYLTRRAEPSSVASTPAPHGGQRVAFPASQSAAEPDQQLEHVLAQDPTLDADLAEWHNDTVARPKIGILGEPTVAAPGTGPTKRRPWYTEVLVYLALHPHGVTADTLTTDLWDGRQVQPVTYRETMSTARKWAGVAPDGQTNLTQLRGTEPYKLRDFIVDWDLFRRLRKRAEAYAAAGATGKAIDDYRDALRLIRGAAFCPLRPGGYTWLANRDQAYDRHLPGFVAETAHALVTLSLAHDDPDLATWAANTALRQDIYRTDDRPLLDLMRISHTCKDHTALHSYAHQLIADADVEVPEDLPPETFAVFNELLPRGLKRGA